VQLTKVLERLSDEEVRELLARWGFDGEEKIPRRAIADALSQPRVLASAFRHLDAFQLKVFRWILEQPGYEARWPALTDALGDRVPYAYLEQELQDIRLWGLIDFRAEKNGFVGTYPAAATAYPARTASLRDQLAQMVSDDLRQVCSALGVKNPPTKKEGRLAAVLQTLGDPATCRAAVDALPPASRELLEWVRGRGGRVTAAELAKQPGASSARQIFALPTYTAYVPHVDPIHDLTRRCLLLPVSDYPGYSYYYTSAFVVAEEVERALTGGSFFDDGPLQPPRLETAEVTRGAVPNPLHLVRDLGHLLGFVASGRCEWRQDREPYVRSLTAFGKAVKHPDKDYPTALWSLGTTAGILYVEDYRSTQYTAAEVKGGDPTTLARMLIERWALGGIPDLPTDHNVVGPRQALLGLLMSIPPDVWITKASMLQHLTFKRPLLFASGSASNGAWPDDWNTMRYLAYATGTSSQDEPAIMVPAAVRPLFPSQEAPAPEVLPPWDDSWVIQPDRTIIVPPNVPPGSLRALWEIAQLEDNQGAAIFRLTADSVARALNRGLTPTEVETTLRSGSKTDLPNTVVRLLQDQGKRYGQIKLGSALTYVRTEDPAILEALVQDRKLGGLRWRLLAPGVAVVESAAPAAVLETLRKAGHLPVMDEALPTQGQTTPAGAPARGQQTPARPLAQDPALRQHMEELVSAAMDDDIELAVKWREDGRTRTVTVLPYALADGVLLAEGRSGRDYAIPLDSIIDMEEIDYSDDEEDF
jgi:hypothetical protein